MHTYHIHKHILYTHISVSLFIYSEFILILTPLILIQNHRVHSYPLFRTNFSYTEKAVSYHTSVYYSLTAA